MVSTLAVLGVFMCVVCDACVKSICVSELAVVVCLSGPVSAGIKSHIQLCSCVSSIYFY